MKVEMKIDGKDCSVDISTFTSKSKERTGSNRWRWAREKNISCNFCMESAPYPDFKEILKIFSFSDGVCLDITTENLRSRLLDGDLRKKFFIKMRYALKKKFWENITETYVCDRCLAEEKLQTESNNGCLTC